MRNQNETKPTRSLKVRTLGDLTRPIVAMADDVVRTEQELDASSDSYLRRNYVRSLFAFIEGSIYLLKQTALTAALRSGIRLTPDEYAILAEQTFDLDASGKPRRQPKFLHLASNVRFTVASVNRVFGANVAVSVEDRSWNDFRAAIEIRNRITHPNGIAYLEVSPQDVRMCKRMSDEWFNELVSALVSAVSTRLARI